MNSSKKILIVGPTWVGDMVMAQTLFICLKHCYPDAQIDVLAPAWTKPLLEGMPEISGTIDSPFGHGEVRLRERYRLGVALRERGYDQAIVLQNSYKSALIPYWANIPQRTGWVGEMRYGLLNDIRRLDKKRLALMIHRYIALGLGQGEPLPTELPWPQLRISPAKRATALSRLALQEPVALLLALCPGAEFGPAKQWPAEYYAEVAKNKLADGWQVWIFGSSKDKVAANRIESLTGGRARNLAGVTTLSEAVHLLSLASGVIANDSGLLHVAAALDRPVIAVYGPTTPSFTPPLSKKAETAKLDLPCSPCFKRECPYGHQQCMKSLKPAIILETMEKMNYVSL
ncbi:lipopolysaccharide heptosyltransferase II [Coxiella endosymbiont of Ornithodoros maritimus]|uniref:lipopolysaccharide heptosyltransferase II n=1 Tax=Coxiella endosymbiont of Ornithodoros maritimus TaxID=1656172 RepID=UPI0022643A9E|nr:lipopolysaccharide heptosyltransferase II [Coxiella endosymbiont of Ornithodoros maritimus]